MHYRSCDVFEYCFIGKLERINDLDECRHILQSSRADFVSKAGDIKPAAAIGPAPVRVALEISVLQMESADRITESVEPFGHPCAGPEQRLIQGVAVVD